jgi:hypothetical protein
LKRLNYFFAFPNFQKLLFGRFGESQGLAREKAGKRIFYGRRLVKYSEKQHIRDSASGQDFDLGAGALPAGWQAGGEMLTRPGQNTGPVREGSPGRRVERAAATSREATACA